jgi:hypothetical protein
VPPFYFATDLDAAQSPSHTSFVVSVMVALRRREMGQLALAAADI